MNDEEFAHSITATLNQATRELGTPVTSRLSEMRRHALAAGRDQHRNGHGVLVWTHDHPWITLIMAVCIGVAGWAGFQRQYTDNGEVDIQLLTDDLPPQAYADGDFATWLKSHGR